MARISIPVLSGSSLCPVAALTSLLETVPGSQNDPLFTILKQNSYVPLTDSMVRKRFKRVVQILHWQHFNSHFTPSGGLVPPGHTNMGFPSMPLNKKARGPLTVYGVIYQHSPTPLLCSKLSTNTYISDGCLGGFSKFFKVISNYIIFSPWLIVEIG